jgi:hypothetical protein
LFRERETDDSTHAPAAANDENRHSYHPESDEGHRLIRVGIIRQTPTVHNEFSGGFDRAAIWAAWMKGSMKFGHWRRHFRQATRGAG